MKIPDAQTVFLVSGGAKGITAECVKKLAERFHSTFILVGRSPLIDDPAWAEQAHDDAVLKHQAMQHLKHTGASVTPKKVQQLVNNVLSSREIRSTLADVAIAGGQAHYISVDITDLDALTTAVKEAEVKYGAISGCIHGAGVLADKLIQDKTPADIDRVMDVKLHGLMHMLTLVPPDQLDYLVLFSSVAGFYGNIGQADYAAANEILNKVAHQVHYHHPDCRVVAINWGPWDGGMVTPALKAMLVERNIAIISLEKGTDFLADTLIASDYQPQLVVGGEMLTPTPVLSAEKQRYRVSRELLLEANPFLQDHVIGGHAVLPTVCAVAWVVNVCEQLYPGLSFTRVDDYRALKGIVFDEHVAHMYHLDLEEVHKSATDGVVLDTLISSMTDKGKPRFHYKMKVTLGYQLPDAPAYPHHTQRASHPIDGAGLYSSNTLFHGPCFQGIQQVLNIEPGGLTMLCKPPQVSLKDQGQFQVQTFNPFVTDVHLQSLLVWANHTYGYGGLPLRIQSGVQYRQVPDDAECYASLEVKEATRKRLVADVIVHDAKGVVYSWVGGAEITLSERLNALFEQNRIYV
ncbi:MAG: SDR family NAD(P)-dependent oxidoreductase [Anaerolineae bacterium]|nr:SDR family NAD(P)-dependent oxidoreductase [Anaerolineae bacterium]